MAVISFTKVNLPYGWLGNMAAYPIEYNNRIWKTSEALFQALRFSDDMIREKIRMEPSPMGAKMRAKSFRNLYAIAPMSNDDIANMKICLNLKFTQHKDLRAKLLKTLDHIIVEDIGKRRGIRHEFWGAYRADQNKWLGNNKMGELLMELRKELTEIND